MRFFEKLKARDFFLIDFIGAGLAVIILGFVIPKINHLIGMPLKVLFVLAIFAGIFMIYSLSCYFFKIKKWQLYLTLIAYANLIYCLAIIAMIIVHWDNLTSLGILYFFFDVLLVGFLAFQELKVVKNLTRY